MIGKCSSLCDKYYEEFNEKEDGRNMIGTFRVAQWLRICLPMQGTWARALVREDPICLGATKPARL